MKKVLFVASEAVPFIKTGGLADVVGSLPKCFPKEYFDVRVVIPTIFDYTPEDTRLKKKQQQLDAALDKIRNKYGKDAVFRGGTKR